MAKSKKRIVKRSTKVNKRPSRKIEAVDPASTQIKPMVIDLSHWDPASDYAAVKSAGYVGCIFKATQGTGYTDDQYVAQQHAAKAAGMKWGAYHFADASNVDAQISNFMNFASPDPDELFCLDWEDNGSNTMTASQAKQWITGVEDALGRPGECVIYSGNTAKEQLGNKIDPFFGQRRLWLAQYGTTPTPQASWKTYWLWQYTDGQSGPQPHSVAGVGNCDISSYADTPDQLAAEWASGGTEPQPAPDQVPVAIDIEVPANVQLTITVNGDVISDTV